MWPSLAAYLEMNDPKIQCAAENPAHNSTKLGLFTQLRFEKRLKKTGSGSKMVFRIIA